MTNLELQVKGLCDGYRGVYTVTNDEARVKKIGEELVELAMAVGKSDMPNIKEECGDIGILLIDLLAHSGDSLSTCISVKAATLETRWHKTSRHDASKKVE